MDTRAEILKKNFEILRRQGFGGIRADKSVAEIGVTKGALYHYFPSKRDLGYAIFDEIITPRYQSLWSRSEQTEANPIDVMISTIEDLSRSTCENISLGCPLNNIAQEMSGLDDGFTKRIESLYEVMQNQLASALSKGKKKGLVKKDCDPKNAAIFIVASTEGAFGIGKALQSEKAFQTALKELIRYINSLRA
ncbi:MAG: TetR/AcrR family transcriptional regulator [Chloroherpetonaceae bacterium]|nr:TetR/AcrR family transcriptional regulator [Chloroherpetonaceae bacterium]